MGVKQGISATAALDLYCDIETLAVEEQKFCYNTATIKKDLYRLMDMGADEFRVCKKVRAINSDFCKVMTSPHIQRTGIQLNDRMKKGIIYI